MARIGASEAASAMNDMLHFSSDDQQALLEVIEDYFTLPDDTDDIDSDDDIEVPGIQKLTTE